MRILHVEAERYDAASLAVLDGVGSVDAVDCPEQADFEAALAAAPYDAVFVRLGLALSATAMDRCPTLRWAVTPTTGLDHLDLDAAAERGVRVVSLRGETEFLRSVTTTAEHTWALLLALRRNLVDATRDVAEGNWRRGPFLAEELHGATLGVVGLGRLGRMVAGYGNAFGMRVLAFDLRPPAAGDVPGVTMVGDDELLDASDVVTLHLPLDDETRGWLDAERIAAMRPGAALVNTARGELVDELALLRALRDGHLAGAALDVLAGDSRWDGRSPPDHPLVAFAATDHRLLVTPHIGGYGRSGITRTRRFVTERFIAHLRGDPTCDQS